MQVTEKKSEGLKHSYTVTIDAKSLSEQTDAQLKTLSTQVKIAGFRPGHIPLNILKQRYGKSVIGEVIERAVGQSSQQVLRDKKLRPALQPKIEITSYEEGGDLVYSMDVEVLPEIPEVEFSSITLEKMITTVDDSEIDEAITRLSERNKTYTRRAEGSKAKDGDQVLIDFLGKLNGVPFDGGAAKHFELVLGSGQFINGFEEQIVGTKEGANLTVKVTFPESYHKEDLAGQPAEFEVTVHEIREGAQAEINEELAKKLGFTDLPALRKAVADQFSADYEASTRARLKKQLFDKLDQDVRFAIPQGMVDMEFEGIWKQVEESKKNGDSEFEGKSEEELREEYTKIAQRRVKLGVLLSEVAQKNKILVNQDELSRAVMQQASQFPGQERRVFEFYQKNPQHLEEMRGPILEEKAVDFILSKVKLNEKKVSKDELLKDEEQPAEEATKKTAKKKKAANA